MKGKLLTIGFSTVLLSILMCSIVHAPWSSLDTGYAVTSNWDGIQTDIPVTITAGTLDSTVTSVTFKWFRSPSALVLDETVPVFTNGTIGYWENGTAAEIRYANSTYVIAQSFWAIQIVFNNSEGETNTVKLWYWLDTIDHNLLSTVPDNSVFHVPEIPLGTIGASVAMVTALGLFMIKRKRQQK